VKIAISRSQTTGARSGGGIAKPTPVDLSRQVPRTAHPESMALSSALEFPHQHRLQHGPRSRGYARSPRRTSDTTFFSEHWWGHPITADAPDVLHLQGSDLHWPYRPKRRRARLTGKRRRRPHERHCGNRPVAGVSLGLAAVDINPTWLRCWHPRFIASSRSITPSSRR